MLIQLLSSSGLLALFVSAGFPHGIVECPEPLQGEPSQEAKDSSDEAADPAAYLGLFPEVFAPGVLSIDGRYEYGCAISQDGRQIYFGVAGGQAEIRYLEYADGKWSKDQPLIPNATFSFNDPFLSKREDRLYFISDAALTGSERKQDHDIWYVLRTDEGWSPPIHGGPNLNTPFEEYFVSLTDDGTLYFSSNRPAAQGSLQPADFDLYTVPAKAEGFGPARKLPAALNTQHYEADVFVAPDESYVIFCATRPDGLGRGDLYISFRQTDQSWSSARRLGPEINTKGHELCPFVSRDGRYFFYTSNEDIYWVDAELLEDYRE